MDLVLEVNATCYHEAGHAVVALLGALARTTRIEVFTEEGFAKGRLGEVRSHEFRSHWRARRKTFQAFGQSHGSSIRGTLLWHERHLVHLAAGMAAQRRACPKCRTGGTEDRRSAIESMRPFLQRNADRIGWWRVAEKRAAALMRDKAIWKAVEFLAWELLDSHDALEGEDLDEILAECSRLLKRADKRCWPDTLPAFVLRGARECYAAGESVRRSVTIDENGSSSLYL